MLPFRRRLIVPPSVAVLGNAPWWERGAVLDRDYQNSRFWWNGVMFNSEAALNTAIGGTKSGEQRVIGPYVDPTGTNIATNGDMSSGTTGYAEFGTGASINNIANELELTCGGSALGGFLQPIAGMAGRAFRARITGRRGTSPTSGTLFAGPNAAGTSLQSAGAGSITTTSNTTITGHVGCGPDPTYIGFRDGAIAAGTFLLDNFSLVEEWPFLGFTPASGAAGFATAINAVTGPGHAAVKTLRQYDAGGSDNTCCRIQRNTSGNITVDVRTYASASVGINLGFVPDSTAFSVVVSFAQGNVIAALNGVASAPVATAVIPGCAYLRTANNVALNQLWDGTILRETDW